MCPSCPLICHFLCILLPHQPVSAAWEGWAFPEQESHDKSCSSQAAGCNWHLDAFCWCFWRCFLWASGKAGCLAGRVFPTEAWGEVGQALRSAALQLSFQAGQQGFSTCGVVNKAEQHIIFPVIHSYAGCGDAELRVSGMRCEHTAVGAMQLHWKWSRCRKRLCLAWGSYKSWGS